MIASSLKKQVQKIIQKINLLYKPFVLFWFKSMRGDNW